MNTIDEFEKIIGYKFKNEAILETALTHSSYANDYLGDPTLGNERLEFLGDAILDMVVGSELFIRFPKEQEGFLSKLRSEIVCEEALANAALSLGLNEYLRLGKGEELKGGRKRHSTISDMLEAIIAAVYMDGGIEESIKVVHTLIDGTIEKGCKGELPRDFKTELQELYQKEGKPTPNYKILEDFGPDHDKTFVAGVYEQNQLIAKGQGKTKKEAESSAAHAALQHMEE